MVAEVVAVCVVHQILEGRYGRLGRTAIDKRPVAGPVRVDHTGLVGDTQCDRQFHGGLNQALYAYSDEDAAWWAEQLGRPVTPGLFGENLRTYGIDLGSVVIGERWRIGEGPDSVEVRVTKPRVPCQTFGERMGVPRWVKRFTESARAGVYLKVEMPGRLESGAGIIVLERPDHRVSAREAFVCNDVAQLRRLLGAAEAGQLELDADLQARAESAVRRGSRG